MRLVVEEVDGALLEYQLCEFIDCHKKAGMDFRSDSHCLSAKIQFLTIPMVTSTTLLSPFCWLFHAASLSLVGVTKQFDDNPFQQANKASILLESLPFLLD